MVSERGEKGLRIGSHGGEKSTLKWVESWFT